MKYYMRDESGTVRTTEDVLEWARWSETANRQIADDIVGDARVSTVFLTIDHNFTDRGIGDPVLWETMIFGGPYDEYQWRYTSESKALAFHQGIVADLSLGRDPRGSRRRR